MSELYFMKVSCTLHFISNKRYSKNSFEKGIKQQSLVNIQGWKIYLNWTDKKRKRKHCCFEINSIFRTARISLFFFFSTCQALKTCSELSRVKLFRNDLKESNIYFELAEGSGSGKSVFRHPKLTVRWWVFSLSFVFSAMHTRPTSVIALYTL